MAQQSDILHITLKLGTRQFPMNVPRADEYIYREAEKLINDRFRFYADRYPAQGNETYLLMALLDIAVTLKRKEINSSSDEVLALLESLAQEVERQLPQDV